MRKLAAVAVLLVVSLVAAPASAAPLAMGRDRSDNGIFFEYDAESHSLPEYGSATGPINGSFDRVGFILEVGMAPAEAPEPLVAMVSLRLRGQRAVRYNGTFVVRILDDTGERATSVKIPANVVLRPTTGKRRANLAKAFDVEPGWYSADAIFRPAA